RGPLQVGHGAGQVAGEPVRHRVAAALREADGNRARAARRLGIQRQLLYAKIERYGLAAPGIDLSEETTDAVGNPDASAGTDPA
ncbi:helix-turn-helix domain-containing protein, partial [Methylobacterium organophilum]|nr:helix-turn-helix domain-containing protein [Methylobacterium organophilum]